jgi:hypothetical protein
MQGHVQLSSDSNVRFRISLSAVQPGVPDRVVVASLVDEVSNRLQVVLGYAQILHELHEDERTEAVASIERECAELHSTLRSLTGWTRDEGGQGPWQNAQDIDRRAPRLTLQALRPTEEG